MLTSLLTFSTIAAPTSTTVTYYVAHQPAHTARLLNTLHAVSDPTNAAYGQHLKHADVVALQRPVAADIAAVRAHIATIGGSEIDVTIAEDKIVARIPAASHGALSSSHFALQQLIARLRGLRPAGVEENRGVATNLLLPFPLIPHLQTRSLRSLRRRRMSTT